MQEAGLLMVVVLVAGVAVVLCVWGGVVCGVCVLWFVRCIIGEKKYYSAPSFSVSRPHQVTENSPHKVRLKLG